MASLQQWRQTAKIVTIQFCYITVLTCSYK